MAINVGDGILYLKTDHAGVEKGLANLSKASGMMGKALTAAGVGITATLGLAVKKAADFEQAITNAGSVTGKTGEELAIAKEKMEALAKELGRTTVFAASEAADAFYDLSSRGFDVAAMSIEELQPLLDLAAATQSDLTMATETATGTLKAFKLGNEELVRIANVFVKGIGSSAATLDKLKASMVYAAPAAQAFGLSVEETVAILGTLYDANMEGSMAGTSLARMLSNLALMTDPAIEALAELGLTVEDVNPVSHKLADTMALLKERGITATQTIEIFGQIGSKAAHQILDLQNVGSGATDAINEMHKSLDAVGDEARQVAQEQLKTLTGKIKLLKSAVEAVVIPIGNALIPRLTDLAERAAVIAQAMAVWVEANPELTAKIVITAAAVGGFLLILGPILVILPQVVASIKILAVAVGALGGPLLLAVAAVIAFGVAWATNWSGIRDRQAQTLEDMKESLNVFKAFVEITMEDILKGWNERASAEVIVLETIMATMIDIQKVAWGALDTAFKSFFAAFRGDWERSWTIIKDFFRTTWDNIEKGFTATFDFLWNKITALLAHLRRLSASAISERPGPSRWLGTDWIDQTPTTTLPPIIYESPFGGETSAQNITQNVTINGTALSENALKRVVGSALLDLQRQGQFTPGAVI